MSRIAVVTVNYSSEDVLDRFLASVPASSGEPLAAVIADNRPTPESRAIAAARDAELLELPENRGYGGAINAAIEQLPREIEWVLISNPDVELQSGSVDVLLAVATTSPLIAAVGPRVLTPEGDTYPSARSIPSLRTGIGHALFANLWPDNPWTAAYRREDARTGVRRRDAGWLSGSCLLVRRTHFTAIGGFDDDFFMYFEDVDLGWRFGLAGFRNVYEPDAVVMHIGAHSTSSESARMVQAHHDSARRFLAKRYSGLRWLPVRLILDAALTVRSALVARRSDSTHRSG